MNRSGKKKKVRISTEHEIHELELKGPKSPLKWKEEKLDSWLSAFPSQKHFLLYFSKKIEVMDELNNKFLQIIDNYKEQSAKGLCLEKCINENEIEVSKLRSSVSQLNQAILEERENSLRLVCLNQDLKLKNEDLERKFLAVLLLSGTHEKDVALFLQKNPKASNLTDKMVKIRGKIKKCEEEKGRSKSEIHNPIILNKKIQLLEDQMNEMKIQNQNHLMVLKEEIKLLTNDKLLEMKSFEERVKGVTEKLIEKEELLKRTLTNNIECRKNLLRSEKEWVEERDHMLKAVAHSINRSLDSDDLLSQKYSIPFSHKKVEDSDCSLKRLKQNLSRTENLLLDKENLLQEYKMKYVRIEKQLFRLKECEEQSRKSFEDQMNKMRERNEIHSKRFKEMDHRRKLDSAGFREDVRALRQLVNVLLRKCKRLEGNQKLTTDPPTVKNFPLEEMTPSNFVTLIEKSSDRLDYLESKLQTI